ncbi:exported protein of unknown function [Methanoculleus bourgensis]|uniref:Uncharacterized protein n=1 Tax=Methanoculleus bourgensis TaxID=83986 RepID=A0A0X3BNR2_9EURY|nr:exported protein of unknown function [Methanoculleus bourgensis]
MSSEAFTTAMFLIAAIIAAGVLINAIFPVIYTLAGTISSSSHTVDERLSNDVKIVTTYASGGTKDAEIWLKNVGTARISPSDIGKADVFLGARGILPGSAWLYHHQTPWRTSGPTRSSRAPRRTTIGTPARPSTSGPIAAGSPGRARLSTSSSSSPRDSHGRPHSPQVHNHERGTPRSIRDRHPPPGRHRLRPDRRHPRNHRGDGRGPDQSRHVPGSPDADGDRDPEHDDRRQRDPLCRGEEHRGRTGRRHPVDRRLHQQRERSRLCPLQEGGWKLLEQYGDRP